MANITSCNMKSHHILRTVIPLFEPYKSGQYVENNAEVTSLTTFCELQYT